MKNNIYDLYLDGLDELINRKINLKKYDEMINNSGLYFCPSSEYLNEKKENNFKINSDYFFVSNKLYLEKLDEASKAVLERKKVVDDEVIDIVQKSFKNVIKFDLADEVFATTNPNMTYIAKSSDIILFFIYNTSDDVSDEEFIDVSEKQDKFFEELKKQIIEDFKNSLDVSVTVLKHFDL